MDALQNGIDIIEAIANGATGGAGAYWEDAEAFFRTAVWDLSQDLDVPPPPSFYENPFPFDW